MDDTQKIIQEQFKTLPKTLQDAILTADLPGKMKMISEKHKLHIDKAAIFENETMLIMLGLENHTDYADNLKKEMGISDEVAQEITKDVNDQIFLPIRESLKEMENKNIEEAETEQREEEQNIEQETTQKTTQEIVQTPSYQTPQAAPKQEPQEQQAIQQQQAAPQEKQDQAQQTTPKQEIPEQPSNIFGDKLTQQVRSPKENIRMEEPSEKKEKTMPQSVDPYREPIED